MRVVIWLFLLCLVWRCLFSFGFSFVISVCFRVLCMFLFVGMGCSVLLVIL